MINRHKKTLHPLRIQGFFLAEKEGFEPSLRSSRTTPLAGEPLRPLGYFSMPKDELYNCTASQRICLGAFSGRELAERVGFEPTDAFTSPVFKTGSFDHSDISPFRSLWYNNILFKLCQLV